MAVSLTLFKKIARIDWNQDDEELQLYLDGAVQFIEKYTDVSISDKVITYISNGCPKEIYSFPILSVTGADNIHYGDMSVIIYAKSGDTVTINLGDSNNKILESACYELALTMFEQKEMDTISLPVDLQFKVNQFRRSFLS